MADAVVLRNHLIEQLERADAATDPGTRRGCLSVVIIGGGLVGVELLGELTAFADDILRFYPNISRRGSCASAMPSECRRTQSPGSSTASFSSYVICGIGPRGMPRARNSKR